MSVELETDGCCGQQQKVVCTALSTRIIARVENFTQDYEFRFININNDFMENEFTIRGVEAIPTSEEFQLTIEIVYIATEDVTITCDTFGDPTSLTLSRARAIIATTPPGQSFFVNNRSLEM